METSNIFRTRRNVTFLIFGCHPNNGSSIPGITINVCRKVTTDDGEGQRETTLTGRPSRSPEDGMLTTRHDADYLLRGRQPLRQDPWHRSEGLHLSDCPGPRPTDTTTAVHTGLA